MRFESLHLSQLLNEQEGEESMEMPVADSPLDSIESPAMSGGSPETSGAESPSSNTGDQPEDLQQYELNDNNSSAHVADKRYVGGGPIRNCQARRTAAAHPYERPGSPELDLPQTLLDLQDAAIRLARINEHLHEQQKNANVPI